MKARAPGKVVLSGAYAVLEGAPALVTAVDRYVVADSSQAATFEAPEVRAAIPRGPLPHIDASALRRGDRKLGLGSSAAIVVSSLAAVMLDQHPNLTTGELARRVWEPAVDAHQTAQGGGSGIDVVTSAFGGTRKCWLVDGVVHSEAHKLPKGLMVELYAARESASTPKMLTLVRAWAEREPVAYQRTMKALKEASTQAAEASTVKDFVESVAQQLTHLAQLGVRSEAPIVPQWLRDLAAWALIDVVAIHPSGAGGGDIVLCVGEQDGCQRWRGELGKMGLDRLDVKVNAPGVQRVEAGPVPA